MKFKNTVLYLIGVEKKIKRLRYAFQRNSKPSGSTKYLENLASLVEFINPSRSRSKKSQYGLQKGTVNVSRHRIRNIESLVVEGNALSSLEFLETAASKMYASCRRRFSSLDNHRRRPYYLMATTACQSAGKAMNIAHCSGRDKIEGECGKTARFHLFAFRKFRTAMRPAARRRRRRRTICEQEIKLNFTRGRQGNDVTAARPLTSSSHAFYSPLFPPCHWEHEDSGCSSNEIRFPGKSACPKSIATTSRYKARDRKSFPQI